jgi:hypothetical protein
MRRLYGSALLIVMVPAVLLVNFYAWSGLQPFSDDLTLISGFPNEDFIWTGVEYKFKEPLAQLIIDKEDAYANYTDLVVFGDSFSFKEGSNWVYHFVNATGLSAQVMHYLHGIERLVETDLYQTRPPRVVVFEIGERESKDAFRNSPADCVASAATVALPDDFMPLNVPLIEYKPDLSPSYGDYQVAVKTIRNKLFLLTGNADELKTRITPLTVDSLFSNKRSNQLIYYQGDHRKRNWPDDVSRKIFCGLDGIRRQVEANGYTAFAVMLIPDKLSAYSPWLIDDSLAHLTLLDGGILGTIPHSLDVRTRIIQAVEQGAVDFYQPGDTHWSSKGDMLAAEWMVELFQADSGLPPVPGLVDTSGL